MMNMQTLPLFLQKSYSSRVMTNLNKQFLLFLGKNIRQMRERRNISQEEFGKAVGVHRTYVGMVERGEKNITIFSLRRFAEALGVRVRDLIDF